ncbi:MAG TPA: glycosyltransferase family 2 protein [Saprospiraceae bacterium]|nr:glycosyltransferase family 2 protein [Saprospiraceae bacterium]
MPQKTKFPITAIITTYNEIEHIESVLDTLMWVDEVIVVDSYSDDDTVQLAQKKGAKVLFKQYYSPATQKNWAVPQAKHDWVLILDADERCTPKLEAEIKSLLTKGTQKECFWIGRKNYFMGQQVRFSGWQGDKVIRLLRKHCRYEDKMVHEEIDVHGKQVGRLNNQLIHYTFKNYDHFLAKINRYAAWSAQDYTTKTDKVTLYHLWFKPLFRFFSHYFLQLGFLDGKVGFIISRLMAWGVFLRYLKLMELRKNNTEHDD